MIDNIFGTAEVEKGMISEAIATKFEEQKHVVKEVINVTEDESKRKDDIDLEAVWHNGFVEAIECKYHKWIHSNKYDPYVVVEDVMDKYSWPIKYGWLWTSKADKIYACNEHIIYVFKLKDLQSYITNHKQPDKEISQYFPAETFEMTDDKDQNILFHGRTKQNYRIKIKDLICKNIYVEVHKIKHIDIEYKDGKKKSFDGKIKNIKIPVVKELETDFLYFNQGLWNDQNVNEYKYRYDDRTYIKNKADLKDILCLDMQ